MQSRGSRCTITYLAINISPTQLPLFFTPHVEVVIHDLKNDVIFYISNPFSGREAGDPSNLKENDTSDFNLDKNVIGPYEKTGAKGERIRSITAVLRDSTENPEGILCINIDFSVLESALSVFERFLDPVNLEDRPEILFRNEWRNLIFLEIRAYLKEHEQTLENLNAQWRKALLTHLDSKGLFSTKKSVEQVAVYLNISRSTIYKDLNETRNGTNKLGTIVARL